VLLEQLKERGVTIPKTHVASSYGVLNGCGADGGWARAGIALYGAVGIKSSGQDIDLKPVLSLKARVAQVRTIKAGESAGYGRIFTAREDTRLAVLTIGYADGVPRNLSCGNGCVLIRGRRAPIVGSICMDQLTVDVTDIPDAARGDIATLIGRDGGDEITAVQAAQSAGTIPNELLSHLAEIGVISFHPGDPALKSIVFYRDELAFIVPPQHPLAGAREAHIHQLGAVNFVAHNVPSPYRNKVLETFKRKKVPLNMDVEMPTIEATKKFVAAGNGVALLPSICIEGEIERGELVRVPVRELAFERKIRIVHRKGTNLSHAGQAFLSVAEQFSRERKGKYMFQADR
jgi:hypothetical protein